MALVTRGDEFLVRGDVHAARRYYLRAMRLDPNSEVAVDRFVFFGIQERSVKALNDSAAVATSYLLVHPQDGFIRADRALCFQILKRYEAAASDFAVAARSLHSAKYYTFAGWARYRAGDPLKARRLWNSALSIQRSYGPAVGALKKTAEE